MLQRRSHACTWCRYCFTIHNLDALPELAMTDCFIRRRHARDAFEASMSLFKRCKLYINFGHAAYYFETKSR